EPKVVHNMVECFLKGDVKEARRLQLKYNGIVKALFVEVNPIPVKAALSLMNKLHLEYRLPLCPPDDKSMEVIKKEMEAYHLI
ncbi:MAG: dihydrodipicolinate synthase family protein, partial [Anaerovorax sp.]